MALLLYAGLCLLVAPVVAVLVGLFLPELSLARANLLRIFCVGAALAYIGARTSSFLKSKELIFLKKNGVGVAALLGVLLYRLRLLPPLFFAGALYILFSGHSSDGGIADDLNVSGIAAGAYPNGAGGFFGRLASGQGVLAADFALAVLSVPLLLSGLFLFVCLWRAFVNRWLASLRIGSMLALLVAVLVPVFADIAVLAQNANADGLWIYSFAAGIDHFGEGSIVRGLADGFFGGKTACFYGAVLCLLAASPFYLKRTFYRNPPELRLWPGRKRKGDARHHAPLSVAMLLKRDVFCLLRSPGYVGIQLVLVIGMFFLLLLGWVGVIIALLGLTVFCNTLFIQELFRADSLFVALYRKLPLTYPQFILLRIFNAFLLAVVVPFGAFGVCVGAGIIPAPEIPVFLALLIGMPSILCTFWASIILFRFPRISSTDMPLAGGCVFLLLSAVAAMHAPPVGIFSFVLMSGLTFWGIAKGRKQWERVVRNA